MKTNQKILISIVLVLTGFQIATLVCRLIYRSIEESIVSQMDYHVTTSFSPSSKEYMEYMIFRNSTLTTDQAGISFASIITMHVVGSIEAFTSLTCVAILLLIISFVSNVFLNIVVTNDANRKTYRIGLIAVNVLTTIFLISLMIVILLIAATNGPIRYKIIPDIRFPIYLAALLVVVLQLVVQIFISSISAGLVMVVIKKLSHHQNSQGANRSFVKVIILQGMLIVFTSIFLLAIVIEMLTVFWTYNYIIFDVLNNMSILMFLLATIIMYFPLFNKDHPHFHQQHQQQHHKPIEENKNDKHHSLKSPRGSSPTTTTTTQTPPNSTMDIEYHGMESELKV
ncbi:hypothetical protein C9374_014459 [Naegleria lovaniensis]|uniref:Uncharacterized protein n=1 Tax=Naegleria lovaniensis TaxID=51637 RepID=A0AA88H0I7_NAELO|nr:uncharacterized protein C9374_014459 [Naegleria lovaniensis]KAG2389059.1 hypothetical protein C9374_014459 [Naegleria lovaniensis]